MIKDRWLKAITKNLTMGDYLAQVTDDRIKTTRDKVGAAIAFTNCNVFDGVSRSLQSDMTVLVHGDRIIDLFPSIKAKVPDGFYRIKTGGKTLMPGLIDAHVHQCSPFTYKLNLNAVREMPRQIALNNRQTIYSGVTSVCDMGGPQSFLKEFTRLADHHDIPGPRYMNCFTLLSPRNGRKLGYPAQVRNLNPISAWLLEGQVATRPKTIQELRKVCYKVKDDGGDHLKVTFQSQPFSEMKYSCRNDFPIFDDEWMKAILSMGKEMRLTVDIHAPYGDDAEKILDTAIKVDAKIRIQHMTFDRELTPAFMQKMHDSGYFMIPTVNVYGDSFHMPEFIQWLEKQGSSQMMPEAIKQSKASIAGGILLESLSGKVIIDHDFAYFRKNFDLVKDNTCKAHEAGIIGLGTDNGGTNTGFFGRIGSEVAYYADCGIPAADIMRYLTSGNALVCGLGDRGVIKPGKLADLILVEGNPLIDPVGALNNISSVMKGGVFLKHEGIDGSTSLSVN